MKIKVNGEIKSFNYTKNAVKMTIAFEPIELANAASTIQLLNVPFNILFEKDGARVGIKNVLFDGLNIKPDGASIFKICIEPKNFPDVTKINKLQNNLDITIGTKSKKKAADDNDEN